MLPSAMGTPFDAAEAARRGATGRYLEEWVPRFVPYHVDLVRELVLGPGHRVLVTSAGVGAEVIAVARAVGDEGVVRATDPSAALIAMCQAHVAKAGFGSVRYRLLALGGVAIHVGEVSSSR